MFESTNHQIKGEIRAVVKRAIEGGDTRPDLVFRPRLHAIAKFA